MFEARNMEDVIRNNKKAGEHFFDEDTMAFWGSEICSELLPDNLFITAEANWDGSEKLYTVRRYDPNTAEIDDVSEFQAFRHLKEAFEFAEEYSLEA